MSQQIVFNLALGFVSFSCVFGALVMDFFDRRHGSYFTRAVLLLMTLVNVSYLIRGGVECRPTERLWFWLLINILFFLHKYSQLRNALRCGH